MEVAEKDRTNEKLEALTGYKELYWEFFYRTKYQEYYLLRYKTKAETILSLVSGLCVVATFVSVTGSLIAKCIFWWVAAIVTIAQIAQAIIPYTTVHKKVISIGFMLPGLQRLLLDIETTWNEIYLLETVSLEKIPQLLQNYEQTFSEMELKYLSDCNFEKLPTLLKKAEESAKNDCKIFFKRVYNVDLKEVKV